MKRIFIISIAIVITACNPKESVFQGYVEGEYSYISSAVSGNLTKRLVNRGDQVIVSQPLFVLDPQPETARLEQAKSQLTQATQQLLDLQKGQRSTIIEKYTAQLEQARAGSDFSSRNLERYQSLYKNAAIDKSSLDQAVSQYNEDLQLVKSLEAQLAEAKLGARENQITAQQAAMAAAEAAVKQAEWALLQKSVRSPVNAQVFDTLFELGEFVGSGQPVVSLLPPEKIKLIFFVPENFLSRVKINSAISINCDSCKQGYGAKVNFISPTAEFTPPVIFSKDSRDKLVYRIEAKPNDIEVAKKLHPGQPVDVTFDHDAKTK